MPHFLPAPDLRVGSGYGNNSPSNQQKASNSWPYHTLTDLEEEDVEIDEETLDSLDKKVKKRQSVDPYSCRSSSFVGGGTRGLSGVMDSLERDDSNTLLEKYIKALQKGSQSYVANNADPTARIGPSRKIGTKKGWSMAPEPKITDPEFSAYTLDDATDEKEEMPIKKAEAIKKRNQNNKKELIRKLIFLSLEQE